MDCYDIDKEQAIEIDNTAMIMVSKCKGISILENDKRTNFKSFTALDIKLDNPDCTHEYYPETIIGYDLSDIMNVVADTDRFFSKIYISELESILRERCYAYEIMRDCRRGYLKLYTKVNGLKIAIVYEICGTKEFFF